MAHWVRPCCAAVCACVLCQVWDVTYHPSMSAPYSCSESIALSAPVEYCLLAMSDESAQVGTTPINGRVYDASRPTTLAKVEPRRLVLPSVPPSDPMRCDGVWCVRQVTEGLRGIMGGKAGKGGGLTVYRRIYDIFAAIGETRFVK